ncbi:hypothetical protein DUI87_17848 [Hirundo rustica rustica]|uniref:G-protein coupled receptors family 2 profile 2 domain-containing protein n=1 Tax=Hirundo rustica rustica TaxID=333673 RepID=A0A3M0JUS4_HIRRU|nr:hypothetical protein DUI87_17848 [Hirundo rustica rustica]
MRTLRWLLLPLVTGIHPECKIFQQVVKEEALCSEHNESASPDLKGFLQRNCTQEEYWSEPFPPYTIACGFDEGSSKGPEDQKSYYSAFWRVYTAGYAASVTSLITALIVFAAFRKFHCTRNYIHMHLFVSFILRAVAVFTKDAVLFADETMDHCLMSTVACKAAVAFFQFSILANFFWLLIEGIYLQTLLLLTFVSNKKRLAKSTLLLIPLFGVHYIVFAFFPESTGLEARLYIELGLGSFQVQTELKKQLCKWQYQEYLTFTHKHGALSRETSPVNYVTQLSLLDKLSPKRRTSALQDGVTTV